MTYSVRVNCAAQRDLDRLPASFGAAVLNFIYGPLAENPRRVGKPLRYDLEGLYAARRGQYRINYAIQETEVVVDVVGMNHRRDIYHR